MAKFLSKTRMLGSMAMVMTRHFASRYDVANNVVKQFPSNMSATCRVAQATRSVDDRRSHGYRTRDFLNKSNGINETDQRFRKITQSFEGMKLLSSQRPQVNKNFGVPFKQEKPKTKIQLKDCKSVEDILKFSTEPTKLATELLGHMRRLEKEKQKSEEIAKKYRQLEAYVYRIRK